MVDKSFFDDLSAQITRLIPAANALGNDVKNTISAAMQSSFQKMDLVTREEFDAQKLALERAQERIIALEALLVRLEADLAAREAAADPGPRTVGPGDPL